jgi:hypothetical protein
VAKPKKYISDKSSGINVIGLKELQRELKNLDADWPKELRKANKEAAEMVATRARRSFARGRGVAPKVVPSIRALAQARSAAVKIGGQRFPFAMGAEFGGGKYRKGRPTSAGGYTTQFLPHRGKRGYHLYPTLRDSTDEVVDIYGDLVDALTRRAFPD